jgi:phosphomannomutase
MNNLCKQWLQSSRLTSKEKQEIKRLTYKEQDIYFAQAPMSFGTAGVRGKMGMGTIRMNRFTYANLVQAYVKYIVRKYGKNKTIVIGHDNRLNSDKFAMLAADVASSFGIKVLLFADNQLMPTPIVSYAIRQTKSVGGLIITASHNPKEYNGFKAYHNDGGQILPDVANAIVKNYLKSQDIINYTYTPKHKLITYLSNSIVDNYLKDARVVLINKGVVSKNKTYPVVFTAHHGTASKLLPKFLKQLKFNIKPVTQQTFFSPSFVNSPISNPEVIESFDLSIKLANKVKSNIAIGVDPDADRMAVCIKHQGK